jgi:hypothetical protein
MLGDVWLVCNKYNSATLFSIEALKRAEYNFARFTIEVAGRLVGKYE